MVVMRVSNIANRGKNVLSLGIASRFKRTSLFAQRSNCRQLVIVLKTIISRKLGPPTVAAAMQSSPEPATRSKDERTGCHLCTILTAKTVNAMLAEAHEAVEAGADIVELRIDYLQNFNPKVDLATLKEKCPLPAIITFRPTWEDPNAGYQGPEEPRLDALLQAVLQGFAYVDIELKAAEGFCKKVPATRATRLIVSSHDFKETPHTDSLIRLISECRSVKHADIVKFACMATDISDAARVLCVLKQTAKTGCPMIGLAMGERGQITRLLAPKYGGYLTFGALSPERASAPGQPPLEELVNKYRLHQQTAATKVYGIVGNPVSHSKSPAIHNAAMALKGFDGVYVPLLVDDMDSFLKVFSQPEFSQDWAGFSVTIPHKEAAFRGASSVDPVAAQIGAVNTLVRQSDGGLKGYNTDCSAAISAIERGLKGEDASPLKDKLVVVIGAGGAGRALAFGAASKGASVTVANRNTSRAEDLVACLPLGNHRACSLQELAGSVRGDVLINTTSVGMHPNENESPVPKDVLKQYTLVFDAVYTPRYTTLLRDAQSAGCITVTGDEMFVGQAADQFKHFTHGLEAPIELMRDIVLGTTH